MSALPSAAMALEPREIAARLKRIRAALAERGVDAAILSTEANFAYCTGYTTPSWVNLARPMAVIVEPDRATAIVSRAEGERIAELAMPIEVDGYTDPVPVRAATGDTILDFGDALADRAVELLGRRPPRRLGVELSGVAAGVAATAMERIVGRAEAEAVDVGPLLHALRRGKSAHEVACAREAAQALGGAYHDLHEVLRIGMTEREIRNEMMAAIARNGAERIGFVTVVVGATNPLCGPATDRRWSPGDLLMIDAGATIQGYWADLSRLWVAGTPSSAQTVAYETLLTAFAAGHRALRAGVRASALAGALASGLPLVEGRATGRLGHGVGLELTEPPSLAGSDDTVLPAGAVLCLEPHAWFEEVGYVIGEEIVVVTEDGDELLSPPFPATLPVIDRS